MMSTIEDLKTRRSCRKFKDEQISDEELKTILETATYAPTGKGAQSPKIVVIQNPDTIKELSAWNRSFFPVEVPEDVDPFYGRHCSLSLQTARCLHTGMMEAAS